MRRQFGTESEAVRILSGQIGGQGGAGAVLESAGREHARSYSRIGRVSSHDSVASFQPAEPDSNIHNAQAELAEYRLLQELQHRGALAVFSEAARTLEAILHEGAPRGIVDAAEALFDAFQSLARNPASLSFRGGVVAAAEALAARFRAAAHGAIELRARLDEEIERTVREINRRAGEVAALDTRILSPGMPAERVADAERQQRQIVRDLTERCGCAFSRSPGGGVRLLAGGESALVDASQAHELIAGFEGEDGTPAVRVADGEAIPSAVVSGKLGGLLLARERAVVPLIRALDRFSSALAAEINKVHRAGFDLAGLPGRDIFLFTGPASPSARNMVADVKRPEQIAASEGGRPEDGRNLSRLTAIWKEPIVEGQTPGEFLRAFCERSREDASSASAEWKAVSYGIRQLGNLQSQASDLSQEEESARLFRFLRALEAAARVVREVDELTQTPVGAKAE